MMSEAAKIEMKEFFDFAEFMIGDIVWDFGCGTGRFIEPLTKIGCKVYATDKNTDGNIPDEKVDKVLFACVLHYNDIIAKTVLLVEAYMFLNKDGHIVIIEPNPRNPFFYYLYFWRWLTRSKCPRRWYNEKYMMNVNNLCKLLEILGFKNIRTAKYAWFPSKFGWLKLNKILNAIPIVNTFNAFNWIRAEK